MLCSEPEDQPLQFKPGRLVYRRGLNIRKQLIELLCGGPLSFEALLLQTICSVCGSLKTTDVSTSGLGFPGTLHRETRHGGFMSGGGLHV